MRSMRRERAGLKKLFICRETERKREREMRVAIYLVQFSLVDFTTTLSSDRGIIWGLGEGRSAFPMKEFFLVDNIIIL